jgi:hypothetical protein
MYTDGQNSILVVPSISVNYPNSDDLLCTLSCKIPLKKGKGFVSLGSSTSNKIFNMKLDNDQVRIQMREDVAVKIAEVLIDTVGRMTALRAMHMCAEASERNNNLGQKL